MSDIYLWRITWDMNALSQYLSREKVNQVAFATRIEATQATVSRLARGKQQPTLALAERIERVTEGQVGLKDWPAFAAILKQKHGSEDSGRGASRVEPHPHENTQGFSEGGVE